MLYTVSQQLQQKTAVIVTFQNYGKNIMTLKLLGCVKIKPLIHYKRFIIGIQWWYLIIRVCIHWKRSDIEITVILSYLYQLQQTNVVTTVLLIQQLNNIFLFHPLYLGNNMSITNNLHIYIIIHSSWLWNQTSKVVSN